MEKWYQVDVEVRLEQDNGKIKRATESYLVYSTGVTEAEAETVRDFKDHGDIRDYRIKNVKETKFVGVIGNQ